MGSLCRDLDIQPLKSDLKYTTRSTNGAPNVLDISYPSFKLYEFTIPPTMNAPL